MRNHPIRPVRYRLLAPALAILLAALLPLASVAAQAQTAAPEWPADARDVSLAVAGRIVNGEDIPTIRFDPTTASTMEGAGTDRFARFTRGEAIPLGYENDAAGSAYSATLYGVINLRDPNHRYVGFRFLAKYAVDGEQILVRECAAVTASPDQPILEVYLVQAKVMEKDLPACGATKDWESFHAFVRNHAYKPDDTAKKRDWYVVTFVMDRLPPGATFEPVVSKDKQAESPDDSSAKDTQRFFDYDGWRGHIFAARFKPTSSVDHFYVNYYYVPGPDAPETDRTRRLIARYDTGK